MTDLFTPDVSADQYHSDDLGGDQPYLSATIARLLVSASPLHAWMAHPKLNPNFKRDDDPKYDIGTAVHSLLLEGEDKCFVVHADSWRTKDAKEAREAARLDGRVPLLVSQYEEALEMLKAVKAQIGALEVDPIPFIAGNPEQRITWTENGVACKARPDWLHDGLTVIDDLKTTTRPANPETWSRTLYSMGYDVQAAFYRRAVRSLSGKDAELRFVVAECSQPYAISVLSLTPEGWALADSKVDYALNLWKRCLELDRWDAYPRDVCYAAPPSWEQVRWLEHIEEAA